MDAYLNMLVKSVYVRPERGSWVNALRIKGTQAWCFPDQKDGRIQTGNVPAYPSPFGGIEILLSDGDIRADVDISKRARPRRSLLFEVSVSVFQGL